MKKTLIALLALGSTAIEAAELVAEWKDFSSTTSGSYTLNLSGNSSVGEDGILALNNNTARSATIDLSAAGLSMANGFTISMTLSNVTALAAPVSVWSLNTTATDHVLAALYYNDYSKASFAYAGSAGNVLDTNGEAMGNDKGAAMSVLGTDDITTLTITVSRNDLIMYQDGIEVLACTADITKGDCTNETLKTLALGSWSGTSDAGRGNAKVYNLAIYEGAMSAAEVSQLVPEPTTATLSLLALAGLATRRRRK